MVNGPPHRGGDVVVMVAVVVVGGGVVGGGVVGGEGVVGEGVVGLLLMRPSTDLNVH